VAVTNAATNNAKGQGHAKMIRINEVFLVFGWHYFLCAALYESFD
jgi:hypothetical protein